MGTLTSYGAHNLVITRDYSFKTNQIESGEPEVYVKIQPTGSSEPNVVDIRTWYMAESEERAGFKYVGMDYDTAQTCANAMKSSLTFQKYVWEWGTHWNSTTRTIELGWYQSTSTPTLESNVSIVKTGQGSLYDVVVEARHTQTSYSTNIDGNNVTGSRPLYGMVTGLSGWNDSTTPSNGKYNNAASASNIVIVSAPTYTREWEMLGADITTAIPDGQTMTGFSFPIWYKARTTYQCQVKYVGMTRSACRSLFNSLNGTNGWWYAYHPYEYKAVASGGTVSVDWVQNNNVTLYQCLNEFTAKPVDGKLWEVELSLTQWDDNYTKNPRETFTPSWPSVWSRVPGLSNYT